MFKLSAACVAILGIALPLASQQSRHVEMASVETQAVERTVPLPAELEPYLQAEIEARVSGYVERVLVDRGSEVKRGQLLIELSAPELAADKAAAESAFHQTEAEESQAVAQVAAFQSTYDRLAEASKTPGAVAGNELIQAEKQLDAAKSVVESKKSAMRAAQERLTAAKATESYLRITAPFDGTITDRYVHPGVMVPAGGNLPLLKLQQISHLRLTVPVPETYVGHIVRGVSVPFHIAAQPARTYSARISRIASALDPKTRAMMVELDAYNKDGTLAPGMYPTVDWPVSAAQPQLVVPSTSVVTTTERTFVITSLNGRAHWIDVRKGSVTGNQVSVRGDIKPGQKVVKQASDELREGTPIP